MLPTCVREPATTSAPGVSAQIPLAVVVPCFNEADSAHKLRQNIQRLCEALPDKYAPEFLFVDDGSRDGTAEVLKKEFRDFPFVRVLKHDQNQGIAAAISTGIRAA